MVLLKRLLLWTIFLHGLILLGLGHSGGFLFFLDLFAVTAFSEFFRENNFNPFTTDLADNMGVVVLLSFLGKLFAIIALFIKRMTRFLMFSFIALVQLWLSYFYLSYYFITNKSAYDSFITGLPFLILSVLFIVFAYRQRKIQVR